jgi:multiple sugar transport system substrate-binding protein
VAAALAGCTSTVPSPSPEESAGSPVSSHPSPTGPVSLDLAVYGDEVLQAAYRELAQAYTERHPSVTVEVQAFASADEAAASVREGIGADAGPDVFVSSNAQVPQLVAEQAVRPLDQLLAERGVRFGDNYARLGLVAFSARQSLQCMPYDVSPLVVLYHRGTVPFRRLAEPGEEPVTARTGWTWEQFATAARLASGPGVKGAYVEPRLRVLLALVRSAGDDLVDDPRAATSLTFSDDDSRAALEEILSVVRDPQVMPSPEQLARMDGLIRFERGKVAMLVGTRALLPELRQVDGLDLGVMPLPGLARPHTVAEVSGYCISAATSHVAEAADFVAFAAGPHGSEILAQTGAVVPAHLPTLNSASYAQSAAGPQNAEVFADSLVQASTVPFAQGWDDLAEQLRPEIEAMFYDPVLDLDTLLPRLDRQSRQVLRPLIS